MSNSYRTGSQDQSSWENLARKDLGTAPLETLTRQTPEGVPIKALYTAKDLEAVESLDTLPGFAPYTRGPRATMYTVKPWTIRQ